MPLYRAQTPIILAQGGYYSHTGTTAQTDIASVTIPADAMGANGILEINIAATCNNNANNKIFYLIHGSSTVKVLNYVSGLGGLISVRVFNRNSASIQRGAVVASTAGEGAYGGQAGYQGTVNTATAQTLKIAALLGNAGDTIELDGWQVLLYPSA